MNRCKWIENKKENYIKYHDEEWCTINLDEHYLYMMLILEMFSSGLSWECVLNKRENFIKAFDNFDINKICEYDEAKIEELMDNKGIIRNKKKIEATISNSKIYRKLINEYGNFSNYLKIFWDENIIYEVNKTTSELSNKISKDLKNKGMKFLGSITIYSYLQAIGIINSHDKNCYKYKGNK